MLMFRVLGPIEVVSSFRTERFRGRLQRSLLLSLLINRGNLVQTESLINQIWPGSHPDNVVNALQAHVSRLRRRLSSLEPNSTRPRLRADAIGYQLIIEDEELDAALFENGIESLRTRPPEDRAMACLELRRLLATWRGPIFGGEMSGSVIQAAAVRYQELWISCLEMLFAHELNLGKSNQIVPELYQLVTEHPYKELFHQFLMTALYRADRQSDALDVYHRLRRQLADDLGLEPSPTMRTFEQAVLTHDDALWSPSLWAPQNRRASLIGELGSRVAGH